MRIHRAAFVFLLASAALAVAAERHIVFERSDAVYVAKLNGSGARKLAVGIFPAISPDGTRVAFTTVEKSGTTYIRHIAVIEIDSGSMTVFKDIPSENSYYPSWSPDGKRIL